MAVSHLHSCQRCSGGRTHGKAVRQCVHRGDAAKEVQVADTATQMVHRLHGNLASRDCWDRRCVITVIATPTFRCAVATIIWNGCRGVV